MTFNPTITGLIIDVVGFILIFAAGGLGQTDVHGFAEDDWKKNARRVGAYLVVIGFAFQIYGASGS